VSAARVFLDVNACVAAAEFLIILSRQTGPVRPRVMTVFATPLIAGSGFASTAEKIRLLFATGADRQPFARRAGGSGHSSLTLKI